MGPSNANVPKGHTNLRSTIASNHFQSICNGLPLRSTGVHNVLIFNRAEVDHFLFAINRTIDHIFPPVVACALLCCPKPKVSGETPEQRKLFITPNGAAESHGMKWVGEILRPFQSEPHGLPSAGPATLGAYHRIVGVRWLVVTWKYISSRPTPSGHLLARRRQSHQHRTPQRTSWVPHSRRDAGKRVLWFMAAQGERNLIYFIRVVWLCIYS